MYVKDRVSENGRNGYEGDIRRQLRESKTKSGEIQRCESEPEPGCVRKGVDGGIGVSSVRLNHTVEEPLA